MNILTEDLVQDILEDLESSKNRSYELRPPCEDFPYRPLKEVKSGWAHTILVHKKDGRIIMDCIPRLFETSSLAADVSQSIARDIVLLERNSTTWKGKTIGTENVIIEHKVH